MASLLNDINPGGYALQGFFKAKEEEQKRAQFNQKLFADERQQSILNDLKSAQEARLLQEERRLKEKFVSDIGLKAYETRQGLEEVPPDAQGAVPGSLLTDIYKINPEAQKLFNPQSFYAPKKEPERDRFEFRGNVKRGGKEYRIEYDKALGKDVETFMGNIEPKTDKLKINNVKNVANVDALIKNIELLGRTPVMKNVETDNGVIPESRRYKGKLYLPEDFRNEFIEPKKIEAKKELNVLIENNDLNEIVEWMNNYIKEGGNLNDGLKELKKENPNFKKIDEKILASYFYIDEL